MKTREAKRRYQRDWKTARRRAWFAGKVCAECGSGSDLQLDHIDPAAKVSHKVWSWSAERRARELDKCQALCRDCHKKRTRGQRAKLTADAVTEIRASGGGHTEVARRHGVSEKLVRQVRGREVWKDV
jgi:5-methylcytosine-specific restriction endonuclease McrA